MLEFNRIDIFEGIDVNKTNCWHKCINDITETFLR